ncbi:hypothetical protein KKB11_07680, partial [Candidatus Micrarchaeota archaeon]|nr:hypothetical protein [Candidatus Micrarchaeota archaeon]
MPKKREYFVGDIEIVALSPIYTDLVSKFECQIKDLNDFINDDALQQHEESINFTYLWISKKSKELLGYITICCDSIHLSG